MIRRIPRQTTVVIPCWNAAEFVASAIESCLSEGVPERQIVVVDDGSTDDTPQVLKGWANRIRVLREENRGAASARNAGLAESRTEHVIFLDADDVYEGGMLGALEAEMLATGADLGLGCTQVVRADGRDAARRAPPATENREGFIESWLMGRTVQTNSHMWRSAFLRQIGGWRTDMKTLEEIELVLRAMLAGSVLAVSLVGQSRYIDRGNVGRVSRGNSENVIRSAVDGFANIEAQLVTDRQRRALGHRYYLLARAAFRMGYVELGRETLARARACGFPGHLGTRGHQLLSGLVGLELKETWMRQIRQSKTHQTGATSF